MIAQSRRSISNRMKNKMFLLFAKLFAVIANKVIFFFIIYTQNTRQLIVLMQWNLRVKPAKQKGADWAGFTRQAEESAKL